MKKYLLLLSISFIYLFPLRSQVWTNLATGAGSDVLSLCVDTSSGLLYAGGSFTTVSGFAYQHLATWNGASWGNIGADGAVTALADLNGSFYAGGSFATIAGVSANRVAKLSGGVWQPLGGGVNSNIYAFAWYGGLLYAGGSFSGVNGFATSANHVASWNGTTWSRLGPLASNGTTATGCCLSGTVNALCVYGGYLYVGGEFTKAGGVTASCIAKWDGSSWSAVGSGIGNTVTSLAVFEGKLYAGGNYTSAGGMPANYIAAWDGSTWSNVGSPTALNNPVWGMQVINNELYVTGSFSGIVAPGTSKFASKWNGTSWSDISTGPGLNNAGFAIAGYDTVVYVGGTFTLADGNPSDIHVARIVIVELLPITLISFTGLFENGEVHLSWKTSSELNSDYFTIEKSIDAVNFNSIGAIQAAGNSSSEINYQFTDDDPFRGINYYRLRETDLNGDETLSDVIFVNGSNSASAIFIYPQPAHSEFAVQLPGNEKFDLILRDISGKIIFTKRNCIGEIKISTADLQEGIYILEAVNDNRMMSVKIMKN